VEPLPFAVVDLAAAPSTAATIESVVAQAQRSLDLSRGPLVRAVVLAGGPRRSSRLLLIFHHLVIDGVSWRILMEDFLSAYEAIASGSETSLPEKTAGFVRWAARLAAFAEAGGFDEELGYWQRCAAGVEPFPGNAAGEESSIASECTVAAALDRQETRALLKEVPAAYRTQINDVLLAALAVTLGRWTGQRRVAVDLEGHGREDLFADLDLTRTVGWFTTHFPVVLPADPEADIGEVVEAVKDTLRAVPRRGIGFGALRYLRSGAAAQRLRELPQPAVSFNYLGQFDRPAVDSSPIVRAAESVGPLRSPGERRTHRLAVVGRVEDGLFEAVFRYSAEDLGRDAVERLVRGYLDALRQILGGCRSNAEAAPLSSGFDLAPGLTQEQLEHIARQVG
jgi:non-ribosomal peptide synthase protein (TIGR01720 family)